MNRIIVTALFIFAFCVPLHAQSSSDKAWSGKWDFTPDATIGGWQSIKSADQAVGVSKRFWHVDKGSDPILNLGLFGGGSKPLLSEPSSSLRILGGVTIAVPGSVIDWALGTNWGSQWIPALKTGILCAYDVTRLKSLKAVPDFVGIGASYPLGGSSN